MNGRIRLSLLAAFAVMLISAISAIAQPLIWNPPCPGLRVKNLTAAPITIKLSTTPAGLLPIFFNIPPGGVTATIPMPAGATVDGVTSAGGFFYPVIQPAPPSPPAPIPANAWIPSVTLGPPPFTCVDLYLDLFNCTVYIFPGTLPCRP